MNVIKRNGNVELFNREKLLNAVFGAIEDAQENKQLADEIVDEVESVVKKDGEIKWDKLNDLVEQLLITKGLVQSAKMFLLHRVYKLYYEQFGEDKFVIDPRDLEFTYNALKVCERRYLFKDVKGIIRETPRTMFERVARAIAEAELKFGNEPKEWEKKFFNVMTKRDFLPNSPTLMNANTPLGQLSACFVLPVGDSLDEIFTAVKYTALIHQTGGGTGFDFSRLRPKGDVVKSTGGVASGPVSFMKVFDAGTETIKQGGRRRGANMGILRVDHPDIEEFINLKDPQNRVLNNFNISVAITDEFMKALEDGREYALRNPRNGEVVSTQDANEIFTQMVEHAWLTGDPGMIFIDRVNVHHPAKHLGLIEATNPCGEQPLLPYESCNLGSINLANMVEDGKINWDKLKGVVEVATRFLDDVIEVNRYPIPELDKMARTTRKIGLGVMGFADLLLKLGLKYDSDEAMLLGRKIMNFINYHSHRISIELARERGAFPAFEGSDYERGLFPHELDGFRSENFPELGIDWDSLRKEVVKGTRNLTNTTIAPTGTISILAGCSSSIEPIFAIAFRRVVLDGTTLLDVHPLFKQKVRELGLYSEELMEKVAETGSIAHLDLPKELKELFRTAHDVEPKWHLRVQAEFQRYTDNAVSKTVNLPHTATVDDVREAYVQSYKLGCKGLTVYRDQSKSQQVIYFGLKKQKKKRQKEKKAIKIDLKIERPQVTVDANYSGGCTHCDL